MRPSLLAVLALLLIAAPAEAIPLSSGDASVAQYGTPPCDPSLPPNVGQLCIGEPVVIEGEGPLVTTPSPPAPNTSVLPVATVEPTPTSGVEGETVESETVKSTAPKAERVERADVASAAQPARQRAADRLPLTGFETLPKVFGGLVLILLGVGLRCGLVRGVGRW